MRCSQQGCKANALIGSLDDKCFWHSESAQERRQNAQKKGGSVKAPLIEIKKCDDHNDLKAVLGASILELTKSKKDLLARCRCIGYLVSILNNVLNDYDLDLRVIEIEKKLEKTKLN
ncbi:MAG: hypothetical protein AAB116_17345 [Candidatus Poribacteria bacterium]